MLASLTVKNATILSALAAALAVLCTASMALAQHHAGEPPATFVNTPQAPTEHRRRGEVSTYGAAAKAPPKPFPWMGLLMVGVVAGIAAPFALLAFRSTSKDLSDLKTVGRVTDGKEKSGEAKKVARDVGKADALGGGTSRDRVWEAVTSVNQWVPVDWVARTAGLSVDEATDELNTLADEGQLEHRQDKSGNPIFRMVS